MRITSLIVSGDHREALGLLAEAYGPSAVRFCAALVGSPADAEELLQEALIQAYQAMPTYRGGGPKAWFFGITRRICIRHLRRRDRRRGLMARWWPRSEVAHVSPDPVVCAEESAALSTALAGLKPHLREVVLLRYQAGLDHSEVAGVLGITRAASRKRASLGLRALRRDLEPILMRDEPQTMDAEPKLGRSRG